MLQPDQTISALLVLLRVSVLMLFMPVLGHNLVPPQVKIGLIALISLLLYPVVSPVLPHMPTSPLMFALIAGREILLAGMLAMLAQLIFSAVALAGQVLSYQMGLAIANVFDPATSAQTAVVSQFATILAMFAWLTSGAQHAFLLALADSFRLLPIGQPWHFGGWEMLSVAASDMFVLALRMVAPMLLLLLFLYVALGLLSRAVPQIQVFFVSTPLTVAVGLLVFAFALPAIVSMMHDDFAGLSQQTPAFLRTLSDNAGHETP